MLKPRHPCFCLAVRLYHEIDTVNPEMFARILFLRMALKDIFATFKIRDHGMIYQYR